MHGSLLGSVRRAAFTLLLLSCLPAASARPEDQAGPPACAGCCNRPIPAHPEPKLSKRQAGLLGVATGVALGTALGRSGASGEASSALTPFRAADALVIGGALLLHVSPTLLEHDGGPRLASVPEDCAQLGSGVNAFDRKVRGWALGERSLEKRELMNRLSWATVTASLAQPVALILSGDSPDKWSRDLPVLGEAAAVSIGVNQAVKHLVHRRRPDARFCEPQRDKDLCSPDARLSFYSGHASTAFVAAAAAGSIADLHRLPNRHWVWASGLTMATATAALRVTADKHYATDVLVGAAAGGLVGWLIPRLHKPDPVAEVAAAAAPKPRSAALGVPLVLRARDSTVLVSGGLADGGPSLQVTWRW